MVPKIPIIDLEEIQKKSETFRQVCEKWGSFRVVNHGVQTSLMEEMKLVAKELLDLPLEIKRNNVDVIPGSGYMEPSVKNPLYEALGLFDIASFDAVETFCSQLQVSPHQREVLENYGEAICKTAMNVANKLATSMGVENYSFENWTCQFRINKYTFNPENIGSLGVQMHTDSGFLTILQDDEHLGGLEVKNELGEYVAVDPYPGTLVVNLGDTAVPWSNGILPSVQHRVRCVGAGLRFSIATFLSPPLDKKIEAPPEFVDDEHPRLYPPVTYQELRTLRSSKKLHCGEVLELIRLGN